MGYLILMLIIGVAVSFIIGTFRQLWARHSNVKWWYSFGLLMLIGIALGVWTGTQFEYQPSTTMRVLGFPVPLAVFIREGENWTDFVTPPLVQYGAVVANVAVTVSVILMPLAIITRLRNARGIPRARA